MSMAAYDRADKLANKALKGFRNAHGTLTSANAILADEAEARRLEGLEWQRTVEQAIKDAKAHEDRAKDAHARNQKTIDLLAVLIGD